MLDVAVHRRQLGEQLHAGLHDAELLEQEIRDLFDGASVVFFQAAADHIVALQAAKKRVVVASWSAGSSERDPASVPLARSRNN